MSTDSPPRSPRQAPNSETRSAILAFDPILLSFLAAPIAASLIIAGIHAYLGLHVVERGVIFVDLSLAQIASLGAAIAVWQGSEPQEPAVYWMSLFFTLIGALVFAIVKGHRANIPQEAIIGITYAVASAAVILTMSQTVGEAEHLRDMLVGNILSVQWREVWITGAIYLGIGVFHYVFRRRFLEISMHEQAAAARGVPVRLWDFLFYASFGLVVTRSVAIAGVLLVFCYLIVPSVGAMLWATRIGARLAIGWTMGVVVSMLGMYFSVVFDLPTGAAIVCTFGLVLVVMAAARPVVVRH
jgi:zinc/manganese transport system permease protein